MLNSNLEYQALNNKLMNNAEIVDSLDVNEIYGGMYGCDGANITNSPSSITTSSGARSYIYSYGTKPLSSQNTWHGYQKLFDISANRIYYRTHFYGRTQYEAWQQIALNSDLIQEKAYTVSYTRGDVGYHASIATLDISDLGLTSLSSIKGITVDSCSTLVSMTGTATTVNTIILSCYTGSAGSDSVNAKVHLFYSK